MRTFEVEVDGKRQRVHAEKRDGRLWLHIDGRTRVFDLRKKKDSTRDASGTSDANGDITAPMPGKILKITAKKGQAVQSGEVLVVMEAMKMEYSLAAQIDGVVQEVSCREGDQVDIASVLVRIESESEEKA